MRNKDRKDRVRNKDRKDRVRNKDRGRNRDSLGVWAGTGIV